MMLTPAVLTYIRNTDPASAVTAAQKLDWAGNKHGITTPKRWAHFLAQIAAEGGFKPTSENLDYSAQRLTEVWPTRFPTLASAQRCAGNPEALGNTVYAGRNGNGGAATGDGYRYRGRGYIQLTGRGNYRTYGQLIGQSLEDDPDLALQYGVAALVAAEYWQVHGLNARADHDDLQGITRAINGGLTGIADRAIYLARAKKALGVP